MVDNMSTPFQGVKQRSSYHLSTSSTGLGNPKTGPLLSSRTTTKIYLDGSLFVTVPYGIRILMNKLTSVLFPTVF